MLLCVVREGYPDKKPHGGGGVLGGRGEEGGLLVGVGILNGLCMGGGGRWRGVLKTLLTPTHILKITLLIQFTI